MKVSELAGEIWPKKNSCGYCVEGFSTDYDGAEPKETECYSGCHEVNEMRDACDLTVELDVEAMAKIISEIAFHKYKPNGEAYLESRPKEVAQYLSQSAKQWIRLEKQ